MNCIQQFDTKFNTMEVNMENRYIYNEVDSALFEDIIYRNYATKLQRQYSEISISDEDYNMVIKTPGQFCFAPTSGAGNSLWWFYHSLDGVLCFIIMSSGLINTGSIWKWQKVPTVMHSYRQK
jgi:hypothetical protein